MADRDGDYSAEGFRHDVIRNHCLSELSPLGLEGADWPRALGAATQIRLITNTVLSSIRSSS
jgi:hypothetical protein